MKIYRPVLFTLISLFFLSCAEDGGITLPEVPMAFQGLYYYSKRSGSNNIYATDARGQERSIILDTTSHDWWVRVSPDRQSILWYKSPLAVPANQEFNNYSAAELWMADGDGGNPHKVLGLDRYGWSAQGVADWSPDGNELVMAVTDSSGFWHIYITDADGRNPRRISQRKSLFADPSWSPDGERIVYAAYPTDYTGNPLNLFNLEIHTMKRDGSDEVRLTFDDLRDHDPYWSPDGSAIAFESQWNLLHCFLGKWAIRKYTFATGLTTDVLRDDNANGVPRWTTDSRSLYFARSVCGEFSRIARVSSDGSSMEIVLENDNHPYYDCDVVE